jgi:site-specific DNA recombinase
MPTAAIYCRISKEDQSIYSLSTQEASCRDLAKDYDVINTYTDDGYSSERLDRPGLDVIRDFVRSHAIDAVIVYSPDRLTRKLGHMLILVDEFERHQVKLLFVTDPTNDSPSGKLRQHVRSATSEYELAMLRKRTRRGQKARIQTRIAKPWSRNPVWLRLGSSWPKFQGRAGYQPYRS